MVNEEKLMKDGTGRRIAEAMEKIAFGSQVKKFGFRRNRLDSNPTTRIVYLGDATNFTPVSVNMSDGTFDYGSWEDFINEICRPVMLKYDGTVDYELNHGDTTKKLDGSASDIANSSYAGNAMVEFRNYRYVSRLTIGDYDYVYFSNHKINDTYKDYAFLADNAYPKETFYFSMFEGSYDESKLRSIAGAEIMRGQTAAVEVTRAKANGTEYDISCKAQYDYIIDLLIMLGKSDDLQNTFGQGISNLSWNDGTNPFGWEVGQTKDKGCFFGESAGTNCVRTLWIEDLWGRAWDRLQGLVCIDGTIKAKMVGPYPAPSDSDVYTDYATLATAPAEGYVKEALCGDYGFIPTVTGGASNTYYCDYFYVNTSGVRFAFVGGSWSYGSACGRSVDLNAPSSSAYASFGARLMKH